MCIRDRYHNKVESKVAQKEVAGARANVDEDGNPLSQSRQRNIQAGTNAPQAQMPVRVEKKVGRNEPCPCGSGKKYKNCCGKDA